MHSVDTFLAAAVDGSVCEAGLQLAVYARDAPVLAVRTLTPGAAHALLL